MGFTREVVMSQIILCRLESTEGMFSRQLLATAASAGTLVTHNGHRLNSAVHMNQLRMICPIKLLS